MIIPIVTPIRTGGSGSGCTPYSSTGEMLTVLAFIIFLSTVVIGFGCSFFYLAKEEDSLGGMIVIPLAVISLLCGLWGLFFMCM